MLCATCTNFGLHSLSIYIQPTLIHRGTLDFRNPKWSQITQNINIHFTGFFALFWPPTKPSRGGNEKNEGGIIVSPIWDATRLDRKRLGNVSSFRSLSSVLSLRGDIR
ncbi:hypothetical protein TNCT_28921 [Trichonephila clavata]|uniref:Uncharacterized protein n=1 Tax=Trichonephila clavata TaxID=2740835 RepID=A0A8X6F2Z4_TRICU|nr:hypothetical protein TNCT_28921 [Trichonephila clavata]